MAATYRRPLPSVGTHIGTVYCTYRVRYKDSAFVRYVLAVTRMKTHSHKKRHLKRLYSPLSTSPSPSPIVQKEKAAGDNNNILFVASFFPPSPFDLDGCQAQGPHALITMGDPRQKRKKRKRRRQKGHRRSSEPKCSNAHSYLAAILAFLGAKFAERPIRHQYKVHKHHLPSVWRIRSPGSSRYFVLDVKSRQSSLHKKYTKRGYCMIDCLVVRIMASPRGILSNKEKALSSLLEKEVIFLFNAVT